MEEFATHGMLTYIIAVTDSEDPGELQKESKGLRNILQ